MSSQTALTDEQLLDAGGQWLAEHAPDFCASPPPLSPFHATTPAEHADQVRRAREWERLRADAGWAGLAVPTELGGQGRGLALSLRFDELENAYPLPLDVFLISRAMVLPTLLAWGSSEQQAALVPRLLDGSHLWCQLFSEPGAGSDLAGVTTRARPDGDGWVVNGQKVWTSFGAESDRGLLIARTGEHRHEGLTAFVVDMGLDGVTRRPIRQASGSQTFGEVFLDEVRLGPESLLGEEGAGWKVVHTTLMNERFALSTAVVPLDALVELARERNAMDDPEVRRSLVGLHEATLVAGLVRADLVAAVEQQREPGPEGSMAKILLSRAVAQSGRLAAQVRGLDAMLDDEWFEVSLAAFAVANGGGTEEILKTLLAERVLGLPRPPRPPPTTER